MDERVHVVIVDGSNVAIAAEGRNEQPSWVRLRGALDAVKRQFPGATVLPMIEPAVWERLVDWECYEAECHGYGVVLIPPHLEMSNTEFLLREADERQGVVVTDDAYAAYVDRFPWLREKRRVYAARFVIDRWRVDPRDLGTRREPATSSSFAEVRVPAMADDVALAAGSATVDGPAGVASEPGRVQDASVTAGATDVVVGAALSWASGDEADRGAAETSGSWLDELDEDGEDWLDDDDEYASVAPGTEPPFDANEGSAWPAPDGA